MLELQTAKLQPQRVDIPNELQNVQRRYPEVVQSIKPVGEEKNFLITVNRDGTNTSTYYLNNHTGEFTQQHRDPKVFKNIAEFDRFIGTELLISHAEFLSEARNQPSLNKKEKEVLSERLLQIQQKIYRANIDAKADTDLARSGRATVIEQSILPDLENRIALERTALGKLTPLSELRNPVQLKEGEIMSISIPPGTKVTSGFFSLPLKSGERASLTENGSTYIIARTGDTLLISAHKGNSFLSLRRDENSLHIASPLAPKVN